MRYFIGPLAEVQVVEGKRVQGLAVEDTVRIFVRSISGVMGTIDLSWSINKELDSYINIYGSHGTVFVGWKESKYRQSSSRDWVVFGNGYDKVQAFRSQINNFSKAIRGEENLLITAEDALASVEVIEAAYAALRQNQWATVSQKAGNGRKPYRLRPAVVKRTLISLILTARERPLAHKIKPANSRNRRGASVNAPTTVTEDKLTRSDCGHKEDDQRTTKHII